MLRLDEPHLDAYAALRAFLPGMRIRIDEVDVPEHNTDTIEPEHGEHRVIVAQDPRAIAANTP